jgi:hypothetical protein
MIMQVKILYLPNNFYNYGFIKFICEIYKKYIRVCEVTVKKEEFIVCISATKMDKIHCQYQ